MHPTYTITFLIALVAMTVAHRRALRRFCDDDGNVAIPFRIFRPFNGKPFGTTALIFGTADALIITIGVMMVLRIAG